MKWRSEGGITLIAILAILAGVTLLNVVGVCKTEMRYVGNSEYIERALLFRARDIKELATDPSLSAVRAYWESNPECCRLEGSQSSFNSTFIDDVLGFKSTSVRIVHRLPDEVAAIRPTEGSFYEAYVILDCCSRPIRVLGMRITEAQAKKL
jgi:hypothetical protein